MIDRKIDDACTLLIDYTANQKSIFLLKGCLIDYYKSTAGDERCLKCPNGKTNNAMHTNCECKEDHYIGENKDGPCYGMYPKYYYIVMIITDNLCIREKKEEWNYLAYLDKVRT